MMRLLALFLGLAGPAPAQEIALPSGRMVTFFDLVTDQPGPAGRTYRFRFIAPQIARDGADTEIDGVSEDMDRLCREFVLPRLDDIGPRPQRVIISISDRPVNFGVASPEVTQFFEAYSVDGDTCIWDGF